MLARIIKMVIPDAISYPIHECIARQASRWWPAFRLYLWLLFGGTLKGIRSIDGGRILYNYQGHDIVAPRNAAHIFKEIFFDEIYERRFKPSGVVVDVGAYAGMFAVKAALSAKTVIAIEPCPAMFEILQANCASLPNIKLVNLAVSSKTGRIRLYLARSAYGNSTTNKTKTYVKTTAITLDDLLVKPVDFIKIDTEGAEMEALKGATRTLSHLGTKLAIAAYHHLPNGEPELPHIVEYLQERGYDTHTKDGYVYAERVK